MNSSSLVVDNKAYDKLQYVPLASCQVVIAILEDR